MTHSGFDALRADTLALCGEIEGLRPPSAFRQQLDTTRAELAAPFYVVVCGEFSRGKSSLLNALVERPRLFPVDAAVTTSVVTELHWGEEETATVLSGDNVTSERRVPVERVADFVTEQRNPGNRQQVRLVRLTAPIERLRHGLALVDTPGIGSLNVEHAMATYAFLAKADAVLFVGAANERMSTAELSYVKDAIGRCRTVITALTKIDRLEDPSPAGEVAVARQRIAQISGLIPDDVLVVGVSALRKRMAVDRDDPHLLQRSGFPELEELLWHRLAVTLGAERLNGAVDRLHEVVDALFAPVTNELTALADERTLADTQARLAAHQERARRLASSTAGWRTDLARTFQNAVTPVEERLAADCEQVLADFVTAVRTDRSLSDPLALVRTTAAALVDAMERAGEGLRAAATGTTATISRRSLLPLTADVRFISGQDVSLELPDDAGRMLNSNKRFMTLFRSADSVGGVGGSLGAGLGAGLGLGLGLVGGQAVPGAGAMVGTVAGSLIGNIVGLFIGWRDQVERARRQRKERAELLTDEMLPIIQRSIRGIRTSLAESAEATRERLLADFDLRIAETQESLATSVAALERLRSATELQQSRRRTELTTRQHELRGFQDRLAALRQRIEALG